MHWSSYTVSDSLLYIALGYFNWVCWIVPNNIVVNQLFGYSSGLVSKHMTDDVHDIHAHPLQGMSLITFDWSQIAYIGSPLVFLLTPSMVVHFVNRYYPGNTMVGRSKYRCRLRFLLL